MIRRLAASLGLCSTIALTAGLTLTTGNNVVFADETEEVSDRMVQALGGASGMTALRREVGRGDTLLEMLVSAGSSVSEADRVIDAMSNYFSPQRLQIGQVMTAVFDTQADESGLRLAAVSLSTTEGYVVANRTGDGGYIASLSTVPLEEALVVPLPEDLPAARIPTVSRLEVRRGDTLIRMVMRGGATRADGQAAIGALTELFDPKGLQVGQTLEMVMTPDVVAGHPVIASLSLSLDDGGFVVVERNANGTFAARQSDTAAPTGETAVQAESEIGPFLETLATGGAKIEQYRIASGDTLMDLMIKAGATVIDADRASRALATQYNERHLQIGQSLYIVMTPGPRGSGLHVLGMAILDAGDDGMVITQRADDGLDFVGYPASDNLDVAMLATLLGEPAIDDGREATQFDGGGLAVETLSLGRGDTIMALLLRAGAERVEADRAIRAIREHIDPQRLQVGQEIRIAFDGTDSDDRELLSVSIQLDDSDFVQADRSGSTFVGRRTTAALNPGLALTLQTQPGPNPTPIPEGDDQLGEDAVVASVDPEQVSAVFTPHVPPVTEIESQQVLSAAATQYWFEIQDGDTLPGLLRIMTRNGKEIDAVVDVVGNNFDLSDLGEGQQMIAITDDDGAGTHIIAVSLDAGDDETIVVVRQRDGGYQLRRASSHVDLADFQIAAIDESEVVEDSAATPADVAAAWPNAPSDLSVETAAFGSGDTLMDVLLGLGVEQIEAHSAVEALRDVYNPRHIRAGQDMDVMLQDGALYGMMLRTAPGERVDVAMGDDGFTARVVEMPLTSTQVAAEGVINSSLYQAAVDAGVPPAVLADMIRAYSFDVDFQREIKVGDSFAILYEEFVDEDGNVVRYGAPTYAALRVSGATLQIYRYTPESGFADYFNDLGESVRKALLRTPVDGARITSGFGMRDHPLLGYSRMHKGVDFGAAPGTPILAAGDGTIEFIGRNSGYGNYIRIRHNDTYKTAYAHMQGFASGLGQGSRVRQGQVIGYVGSTGMSTGPHLHYEVLVHDEQINPLDVKLPSGEKLSGTELASFLEVRDALDAQYAELLSERYVAATP